MGPSPLSEYRMGRERWWHIAGVGYPGLVFAWLMPVLALLGLTGLCMGMVSIGAFGPGLPLARPPGLSTQPCGCPPWLSRGSPVSHSGTTLCGVACGSLLNPPLQSPVGHHTSRWIHPPKAVDDIIVDCHGIAPVMPCMSVYVVNGRSCRDPCYRMGHPLGRRLPLRVI